MTRWVVLDTETTGLDPRQKHRIVEIGLVEIINRQRTRSWHHYLDPERNSDPGALEKHGLTTEFLTGKPKFSELADSMLEFLDGPTLNQLIIHNAAFDLAFLDHELHELGRPALLDHLPGGVLLDTLLLARDLFPGKRNSLDALCERLSVDKSARTFHGALLDAQLLGEVYLAMTRGQETLDMFNSEGQLDVGETEPVVRRSDQRLRVVMPSADELQQHEAQLAQIDKASGGKTVWRLVTAVREMGA